MEYYPPTTTRLKALKESGVYPFSKDLQAFAKYCALLLATPSCLYFLKLKLIRFYDFEGNDQFLASEVFKSIVIAVGIFIGIYLLVVVLFDLAQRGFHLVCNKQIQNIQPCRIPGEDAFQLLFAAAKGVCFAGIVVVLFLLILAEQSADFYRFAPMEYSYGGNGSGFYAEFTRVAGNYLTAFSYIWVYTLAIMGLLAFISRYCAKYYFNFRYRMTKSEIEAEMREGEIPEDVRMAIKSQQNEYREGK